MTSLEKLEYHTTEPIVSSHVNYLLEQSEPSLDVASGPAMSYGLIWAQVTPYTCLPCPPCRAGESNPVAHSHLGLLKFKSKLTKINKLKISVPSQFWVFNSHMWLMDTTLDIEDIELFHHHRKFPQTGLNKHLYMWPQAKWHFGSLIALTFQLLHGKPHQQGS